VRRRYLDRAASEQVERKAIMLITLMTFLAFMGWSAIRPYVPLFAREELKGTVQEVGLVAAATSIAGAALSVPFGLTSAYVGRGKLAVLGTLTWGIAMVVVSSSTEIQMLIVSYGLAGVGFALFDTSIGALVGDVSDPSRMARSFSYFTTAISSSLAVGPALGGLLVEAIGFRATILLGGLLTISAAIIGSLLIVTLGKSDSPRPIDTGSLRRELSGNTILLLGILLVFVSFFPLSGLQAFVPIYGRFIGLDSFSIGLVFTAQFTSTTVSRLLFGDRMDRAHGLRGYALGAILVISVTLSTLSAFPHLAYLTLVVALAGVGFGVINILSSVLIAKSTTTKARGLAMGISSSIRYLGFSLGPLAFATSLTGLGESQLGYLLSFGLLATPTMGAGIFLLVRSSLLSIRFAEKGGPGGVST